MSQIHAVTDAELEALEKQIEQLETDEKNQAEVAEKKKAEAAAKRIADQKRKANAEAEKKRAAELEKQRMEEEKRLAKESKKREEEEKKKKYTMLITEAEQAATNKDKELAISKYESALTIFPDDINAKKGLQEAQNINSFCKIILGGWSYEGWGAIQTLRANGTYDLVGGNSGTWECTDPENRTITLISSEHSWDPYIWILSEDGNCFKFNHLFGEACYIRK